MKPESSWSNRATADRESEERSMLGKMCTAHGCLISYALDLWQSICVWVRGLRVSERLLLTVDPYTIADKREFPCIHFSVKLHETHAKTISTYRPMWILNPMIWIKTETKLGVAVVHSERMWLLIISRICATMERTRGWFMTYDRYINQIPSPPPPLPHREIRIK